jgi:hypothetical protein
MSKYRTLRRIVHSMGSLQMLKQPVREVNSVLWKVSPYSKSQPMRCSSRCISFNPAGIHMIAGITCDNRYSHRFVLWQVTRSLQIYQRNSVESRHCLSIIGKFRFVVLTSFTYSQQVTRLFIFTWSHSDTHTTVGRTTLDEGSARRRDLYLTTQTLTRDKHPCPPWDSNPRSQQALGPQTYALDRAATGIGNW